MYEHKHESIWCSGLSLQNSMQESEGKPSKGGMRLFQLSFDSEQLLPCLCRTRSST